MMVQCFGKTADSVNLHRSKEGYFLLSVMFFCSHNTNSLGSENRKMNKTFQNFSFYYNSDFHSTLMFCLTHFSKLMFCKILKYWVFNTIFLINLPSLSTFTFFILLVLSCCPLHSSLCQFTLLKMVESAVRKLHSCDKCFWLWRGSYERLNCKLWKFNF